MSDHSTQKNQHDSDSTTEPKASGHEANRATNADSLFDSLFAVWEKRTSEYFEKLLHNPTFLNTMGSVMNAGYKNKVMLDKTLHAFWKNLNLPNKRDQERTLHLLNELHSRIFDLEEKIERLQRERAAKATSKTASKTERRDTSNQNSNYKSGDSSSDGGGDHGPGEI